MEIWDVYDKDRKLTGKKAIRGRSMAEGEYHLVVHVWILNSSGELLISQRTLNKTFPNMWECTGGSALEGDSSLDAALREVEEELGLRLSRSKGEMLYEKRFDNETASYFRDVWLFRENVKLSDITYQIDEVKDAMWATKGRIQGMIDSGKFIGHFTYLDDLFEHLYGSEHLRDE